MKYADFMQKYVLHPAGCYDMHIAGTYYEDRRPNEVKYYMHQGSENVYEYNNSGRMVPRCYGENDVPRLGRCRCLMVRFGSRIVKTHRLYRRNATRQGHSQ